MKCAELIDLEPAVEPTVHSLRLPAGLMGFEQLKDYKLIYNPGEEPFGWLRAEDDTALAFVVVDPFMMLPNYTPDIPEADADFLGITDPDDSLLLGIVTVHSAAKATVNLRGPIVVNRHTLMAKQVIIANSANYSLEHPLPVAGELE